MEKEYFYLKTEKTVSGVEGSALDFNLKKDSFVSFYKNQIKKNRFINTEIDFFPFNDVTFKARGNYDIYSQVLGMTQNVFFVSFEMLNFLMEIKASCFQYWPIKLFVRGHVNQFYLIAFYKDAFYSIDFKNSIFSIKEESGNHKEVNFHNATDYIKFYEVYRNVKWFDLGPKPINIKFNDQHNNFDLFYSSMFSSRLILSETSASRLMASNYSGFKTVNTLDLTGFATYNEGYFSFPRRFT